MIELRAGILYHKLNEIVAKDAFKFYLSIYKIIKA